LIDEFGDAEFGPALSELAAPNEAALPLPDALAEHAAVPSIETINATMTVKRRLFAVYMAHLNFVLNRRRN
jgi:hypothetical protein